jgi:hypothetical protein
MPFLLRAAIAVVIALLLMRVGIAVMRSFVRPVPEPPPAGELRKVKLLYRCSVCGTEVRMTAAVHEDPEPPRHCMDEMDLLTPVDDL